MMPAAIKRFRISGFGYTLIEVVMSIVLLGIIASIFISTIVNGAQTYAFIETQNEISFATKFALKRMLMDCRNAGVISSAGANSISFTNSFSESMSFSISGTTVLISDNGGVSSYPLAENITSFKISYYDNANNALSTPVADPNAIQSISIAISALKNGVKFDIRGKLYLRTKPK
jgi:prepilin-type N-terminal cleavage/methylation domain-containing protein